MTSPIPPETSRKDLIHVYAEYKTAIRLYDAQNNTSIGDELYSLFYNPPIDMWTRGIDELRSEVEYLIENWNEDGTPKYDVD